MSSVRAICIDETSFKRGQSYVTVVSDAVARRVIYADEGRSVDNVEAFLSTTNRERRGLRKDPAGCL